jgi:uncharacterized protein YlaI
MPYITKDKRDLYQDTIEHFEKLHAGHITEGELNYLISSLIHSVVKQQGLCYKTLNMVMGVLSCVAKEFYRKVAGPYEEKKSAENGPVSSLDAPGHTMAPGNYPGILMTQYGVCKKCGYTIIDGDMVAVSELDNRGSQTWTCPECKTAQPLKTVRYSDKQIQALRDTH